LPSCTASSARRAARSPFYSEPGHGTTFRVYLPAVEDSVAVPDQAATVAPRLLPPIRVLIVDDQADIRTVAARILHDAGCSVLEAASADEARRICVSHDDPDRRRLARRRAV